MMSTDFGARMTVAGRRPGLLASVALFVGLANGGGATAQDKPTLKPATDASGQLAEVVVTAQRRVENLQSTPVAVSAFSAADLDRQQVQTAKDLNLGVPNVTVVNNTGTTTGIQVYIRGTGQDDSSFTAENKVGLYLDGVYLARELGGLSSIFDISSVEVLCGPQGTLYGRNSAAGAIKYATARPDFSGFGGELKGTFGSYARADVAGVVNIPLIDDKLAIRISGQSRRQDGYVTIVDANNNPTGQKGDGVDQQSARLSVLWKPTEHWQLFATLDGFQDNSGPQVITSTNCTGVATATTACPLRFGDPYRTGDNAPDINRHRQWGTQATVTYDGLSFANVQSISAYRTFTDRLGIDLTGNPAFVLNLLQDLHQKQFSQELTFTSKGGGPFSWTAGALFFREEIHQDATYLGVRNLDAQDANSYAGFAEGRYTIGYGLSAFAGVRYTSDDKQLSRAQAKPSTGPLTGLGTGTFSADQVTPRAGLEWQATPDLFFYVSYAKGYLPGGFAQPRPTSPIGALATFNSETVNSYEAGARSSFFDRKLTFNITGFHTKNNNLSQGVLTATSFSIVTGNAEFTGVEIEAAAHPFRGLELRAVSGVLDASWINAPPGSGPYLKHVPDHNEKFSADYTVPLGATGYEVFFGGDVVDSGRIYRNAADTPNILTQPFTVVDGQIGFQPSQGKWKVTVQAQNLTNKAYIEQGISTLGRYYSRPRTVSVTLDAKF